MLTATALGHWRYGNTLNVSHIIEEAGVSRSSFYEFFDHLGHALEQLKAEVLRELGEGMDGAMAAEPTPMNRLAAMLSVWFKFASEGREAMAVALTRPQGSPVELSPAGAVASERLVALAHDARRTGAFAGAEPNRVLAASVTLEALAARVANNSLEPDAAAAAARDALVRLLH